MQIKTSLRPNPRTLTTRLPVEQKTESRIKDVVTKSAFASGGALAGVGLGVATGGVLSSLTGAGSMTSVGGVLGALAGAATAVAVSGSDQKVDTLQKVGLGWAAASVGSGVGQVVGGATLGAAAQALGYTTLATAAPFIGTATGALLGAAIPLANSDSDTAKLVKQGALVAGLGSLGLTLGTAGQAIAAASTGLENFAMAAPVIGLAAGTTLALSQFSDSPKAAAAARMAIGGPVGYALGNGMAVLANKVNTVLPSFVFSTVGGVGGALLALGSAEGQRTELEVRSAQIGMSLVTGSTGLAIGELAGDILATATGNSLHRVAVPALGAVTGGLLGAHLQGLDTDRYSGAAILGGFTLAAGAVGGAALTFLSGNPLYNQLGTAVGSVNGVLAGMEVAGVDTRKALPITFSASAGAGIGAATGEFLTHLTGNSLYSAAGPIVGLVNGAALGAELSGAVKTKGITEGLTGATAGVATGALLGASLQHLTGHGVWGLALPVLGGLAGGLGVAAVKLNKGAF